MPPATTDQGEEQYDSQYSGPHVVALHMWVCQTVGSHMWACRRNSQCFISHMWDSILGVRCFAVSSKSSQRFDVHYVGDGGPPGSLPPALWYQYQLV